MKQERNRQSLINAIKQLPNYRPSHQVWEVVEQELSLQEKLKELPSYQPPVFVWEDIETKLKDKHKSKLIPIRNFKAWQVAAAIGLLIISTVIFRSFDSKETTNISVTEETIFTEGLKADWDQDEQYFQKILAYYEDHPFNKQIPEYQTLKTELEELEVAKEEIKTILNQYGTNPDIIKQLGKIELERTKIAKKLISLI